MAKKNYKSIVLSYLWEHAEEDVKRKDLMTATGISNSRLSEVLSEIRSDGYTIVSPPRSGILALKPQEHQVILPEIEDCDLRKWIILFLLSKYKKLSFVELITKSLQMKYYEADCSFELDNKKVYDDNGIIKALSAAFCEKEGHSVAREILSVSTLRKDLAALRKDGMVTLHTGPNVTYQSTAIAPIILTVSEDNLVAFCQNYEEHITATSELLPVKQAYHKIQKLIDWDGVEKKQRRFGKINEIRQEQMDRFNRFILCPYKKRRITIDENYHGRKRRITISVALLYYSVETAAFYVLCYNHSEEKNEAIRLDYMNPVTDEKQPNTIYHTKEYQKIYEEMFGPGYEEEVYHVKMLLQDFGNVLSRFRMLKDLRKDATLRRIPKKPKGCDYDYVYEDDVRGLKDFARTLRSFGYSTLALEPPELREQMKGTYHRVLEKYEKLEEETNGA